MASLLEELRKRQSSDQSLFGNSTTTPTKPPEESNIQGFTNFVSDIPKLAGSALDTSQANVQEAATRFGLGDFRRAAALNRAQAARTEAQISPGTQQARRAITVDDSGIHGLSLRGVAAEAVRGVANVPSIAGVAAGTILAGASAPVAAGAGIAAASLANAADIGGATAHEVQQQGGSEEAQNKAALYGAGLGAVTGAFEPLVISRILGPGKGLVRRVATGAAGEALQETPEEGGQAAIENIALNRPVGQNVVGRAALGGLIGGVTGGIFGGAGHIASRVNEALNSDSGEVAATPLAEERARLDADLARAANYVPQDVVDELSNKLPELEAAGLSPERAGELRGLIEQARANTGPVSADSAYGVFTALGESVKRAKEAPRAQVEAAAAGVTATPEGEQIAADLQRRAAATATDKQKELIDEFVTEQTEKQTPALKRNKNDAGTLNDSNYRGRLNYLLASGELDESTQNAPSIGAKILSLHGLTGLRQAFNEVKYAGTKVTPYVPTFKAFKALSGTLTRAIEPLQDESLSDTERADALKAALAAKESHKNKTGLVFQQTVARTLYNGIKSGDITIAGTNETAATMNALEKLRESPTLDAMLLRPTDSQPEVKKAKVSTNAADVGAALKEGGEQLDLESADLVAPSPQTDLLKSGLATFDTEQQQQKRTNLKRQIEVTPLDTSTTDQLTQKRKIEAAKFFEVPKGPEDIRARQDQTATLLSHLQGVEKAYTIEAGDTEAKLRTQLGQILTKQQVDDTTGEPLPLSKRDQATLTRVQNRLKEGKVKKFPLSRADISVLRESIRNGTITKAEAAKLNKAFESHGLTVTTDEKAALAKDAASIVQKQGFQAQTEALGQPAPNQGKAESFVEGKFTFKSLALHPDGAPNAPLLSEHAINKAISKTLGIFGKDRARIKSFDTSEDLVEYTNDPTLSTAAAAYNADTGEVYIVRQHVRSEVEARAALLHEVGVHYGMTEEEINAHYDEFTKWGEAPKETVQRKLFDRVNEFVQADIDARNDAIAAGEAPAISDADHLKIIKDESIAYAVEIAVNSGISPATIVGRWIRRIGKAIARIMGLDSWSQFEPQDLVNFAQGTARRSNPAFKPYAYDNPQIVMQSLANLGGRLNNTFEEKVGPPADVLRNVKLLFGKYWFHSDKQLFQQFAHSVGLSAIAHKVRDLVDLYHVTGQKEASNIRLHGQAVARLHEQFASKHPVAHTAIMRALVMELPKAELRQIPEAKAQLDKTITLKDGRVVTGWDLLTEWRKQGQELLKYNKDRGVYVYNSPEYTDKVISAAEPLYWPRTMVGNGKINTEAGKAEITAALLDPEVMNAMKFTEEAQVHNFVTMLQTQQFEDPLLRGVYENTPIPQSWREQGSTVGQIGELVSDYGDAMQRFYQIHANRYSAKNQRTIPQEVVNKIASFYSQNPGEVWNKTAHEAGWRIAAHKAYGGYINENGTQFEPTTAARNNRIEQIKETIKQVDEQAGRPEREPWLYDALARERLAEEGGLYYSPVAYLQHLIVRGTEVDKEGDAALQNRTKNILALKWLREKYLPAHFNQLGQNMNRSIRRAQEIAATGVRFNLLWLAPMSSVVEVGIGGLRLTDPTLQRSMTKGVYLMTKEVARLALTPDGRRDYKAIVESMGPAMGIVSDTLHESAMTMQDPDQITLPSVRRANEKYFYYTGLHYWTNLTGVAAMNLAQRLVIPEAVNFARNGTDIQKQRALEELQYLGITPEQWDGYDSDRLPSNAAATERDAWLLRHGNVVNAINRFVNDVRLRPTAASRTIYGSDPRFMLLNMLNSYPFAFSARVFPQVARLMARQKGAAKLMPMVTMAMMFFTLGMFGIALKDLAREGVAAVVPGLEAKTPKFLTEDYSKLLYRSATGVGSPLGQYERMVNLLNHIYHNFTPHPYRGSALLSAFGGPTAQLLFDVNQVGLIRGIIDQNSLLSAENKKYVRKSVDDWLDDAKDELAGLVNL